MLNKLVLIRNVGRFFNSSASGDQTLAQYTLILGSNGAGKSTICAILRSLRSGDSPQIIGRTTLGSTGGPTVKLLTSLGYTEFDGTNWTLLFPDIEIFDRTFVNANIHTGDLVEIGHRRGLYRIIIGDQGVSLAEREAVLDRESRDKASQIRTTEASITTNLPPSMDRRDFEALPRDADIEDKIAEQQRIVAAARQANSIRDHRALTLFLLPDLPEDFENILSTTIDNIADNAESHVADHLRSHGMSAGGKEWLAQGLQYAETGTCPFCGQNIGSIHLIRHYRSIFSHHYNKLQDKVEALRRSINEDFSDPVLAQLSILDEQNQDTVTFWDQYCTFEAALPRLPATFEGSLRSIRTKAIDLLDRKKAAPLECLSRAQVFLDISSEFQAVTAKITCINDIIAKMNNTIDKQKTAIQTTELSEAEDTLRRYRASRHRNSPAMVQLFASLQRYNREKSTIEASKDRVRTKLTQHTRRMMPEYQQNLNEYLDKFNADFKLADFAPSYAGGTAASQYHIVINNTRVKTGSHQTSDSVPSFKNTLSEGDRTTLALSFFFTKLYQDQNLGQKVVIFDDPFGSQDSFRRQQTIVEIVKLARSCAQVIILSHDASFLKRIWDKAPPSQRTSLSLVDHVTNGSKVLPLDIENACQGRTATDIDALQTFITLGIGTPEDVVRKMRTVLENYCWTTFPTCFIPSVDHLGTILQKIREVEDQHPAWYLYDEMDEINDYTSPYHHGEDTTHQSTEPLDQTELRGFARRTLKITNNLQA